LLNSVGNHVLFYAWQLVNKRIFYPRHKVVSVQLIPGGSFLTKVLKTEFHVVLDNTRHPPFTVIEEQESTVYFRSKTVIMGCGAQQTPPDLSEKFPGLDSDRLISSDAFLRPDLFY